MVGSKKNTDCDDIVIGRQEVAKDIDIGSNDIRPNDIILPPSDRSISRIHCKIIIKDGFRIPKKVSLNFLLFLRETKRNYPNKIIVNLPDYILKLIWSFIRPKYAFYLVDIGSA